MLLVSTRLIRNYKMLHIKTWHASASAVWFKDHAHIFYVDIFFIYCRLLPKQKVLLMLDCTLQGKW